MEKQLETTIVFWSYIEIMEKKMEITVVHWALRFVGFKACGVRFLSYGGSGFQVSCLFPLTYIAFPKIQKKRPKLLTAISKTSSISTTKVSHAH